MICGVVGGVVCGVVGGVVCGVVGGVVCGVVGGVICGVVGGVVCGVVGGVTGGIVGGLIGEVVPTEKYSLTILFQVDWSIMPSTLSPKICWNTLTAFSVVTSKVPLAMITGIKL